jgi:hypothetical protein
MQGQHDRHLRGIIRLLLDDPHISDDNIIKALEPKGITALITTVRYVSNITRLVLDEQRDMHGHKRPTETS